MQTAHLVSGLLQAVIGHLATKQRYGAATVLGAIAGALQGCSQVSDITVAR